VIDEDKHQLTYEDNSGGLTERKLPHLVIPGLSDTRELLPTIGSYKTGGKKAVFRLATEANILTRYWNPSESEDHAWSIHLHEQWMNDPTAYNFSYWPLEDVTSLNRGQTRYEGRCQTLFLVLTCWPRNQKQSLTPHSHSWFLRTCWPGNQKQSLTLHSSDPTLLSEFGRASRPKRRSWSEVDLDTARAPLSSGRPGRIDRPGQSVRSWICQVIARTSPLVLRRRGESILPRADPESFGSTRVAASGPTCYGGWEVDFRRPTMEVRYYVNPVTGLPHIYDHG